MTDSPTPPQLEVLVTADEDGTATVVLMEKSAGAQIAMSSEVFTEVFTEVAALVCDALGLEDDDMPADEVAIRLH